MTLTPAEAARIQPALGLETGTEVVLHLRSGDSRKGTVSAVAWTSPQAQPLAVIIVRPVDGAKVAVPWHAIDAITPASPDGPRP